MTRSVVIDSTRLEPFRPLVVAPATCMIVPTLYGCAAENISVATPLATVSDAAAPAPKPSTRQALSTARSAPAVPERTGAPAMEES